MNFNVSRQARLLKKQHLNRLNLMVMPIVLLLVVQSCVVIENQYVAVPPGKWRGILKLEDSSPIRQTIESDLQFEEVTEGELPFNFEVIYDDPTTFHLVVSNGEERIEVRDITYGKDRATNQDTIRIEFPVFDSYITALYEEDVIEGTWVVNYRDNYKIPFVAFHGEDHRFTELKKTPFMDISGNWEVYFEVDTETPYPAVGEFKQEGNYLTGTFRTETGDYRYLEGTIQADKVYLSCFDGSHAFLYEAKILADSTMIGTFLSGKHYKTTWEGKRNEAFDLSNPNSLTYLKGDAPFSFEFKDTKGATKSLEDYGQKIKLVQIFGTWCPNCRDETTFLVDYLAAHPELKEEVAVIGLAFERYRDKEMANERIDTYVNQLNVPYDVLLAGYHDKEEASSRLSMLNSISSYPTMLFIDQDNQVRKIHTGFSGPATSGYEAFVKDFDETINSMLAKK